MPSYEILLSRVYAVTIQVEAESPEAAQEIADAWEFDDIPGFLCVECNVEGIELAAPATTARD